ncbi:MAG TPA: hypothetical protein VMU84_13275 [Thermoanaerobaculia bacterium]|nr:hypothetical protein [Thermoanaerobaculia bacterium]
MQRGAFEFVGPVAATGFVLSLVTHVAVMQGHEGPFGRYVFLLYLGSFLVWIPLWSSQPYPRAALKCIPPWLHTLNLALFVYEIVNLAVAHHQKPRMLSAIAMEFYALAFTASYGLRRMSAHDTTSPE